MYDQLGIGKSTHLPEKMGDGKFWTVELFLAELNNLLSHLGIKDDYDLLGQSWGGMLGASHAILQPKELHRLVIADSPADMKMWGNCRRQTPSRPPTRGPEDAPQARKRWYYR
jgi:pimeloyl-ACP methyl ester carboxylesterase